MLYTFCIHACMCVPWFWRLFVEMTFLSCFLIFCSLSNNKISADGVCALVGALLVNQSLQKLKLE